MNGCETDTFDDQENNDTIQYSETEKKCRIARGLSDIIVYCQAQQFNQEGILRKGRNPCHISSFCETMQSRKAIDPARDPILSLVSSGIFIDQLDFLISIIIITILFLFYLGDVEPHLSGRPKNRFQQLQPSSFLERRLSASGFKLSNSW